MKQNKRLITTARDKLLKLLIGKGMSNSAILDIIEPMSGKSQEEKEAIAKQIMKELA